jgi:sulfhydrogenase subunit delta
MKKEKLKVGFYSFTSCEGCQIVLISSQEIFGDLSQIVDFIRIPIIQQYNFEGPFDIVFIEGAITTNEQIKKIKQIRKKTKFLIALGTCATFGGVNMNLDFKNKIKETQKSQDFNFLDIIEVNSLDKYVKIDYKIRGCPPIKEEFKNVIETIYKLNKVPDLYDNAVCIECRLKKNPCLLGKGHDCLGPVTIGGCRALCPSKGIKCYGCRGPVKNSEKIDFLVNLFSKRGLSNEQIIRRFSLFTGTPKRLQKTNKNE